MIGFTATSSSRIASAVRRMFGGGRSRYLTVSQLPYHAQASTALGDPAMEYAFHQGDKFPGSFGPTKVLSLDYWTLRQRSAQLFHENLYARGLIRRLVNNEINVGLTLEAAPNGRILGMDSEELEEWSQDVEDRYFLWEKNKMLCDWEHRRTLGEIQEEARMESYIEGDVLCVLRHSQQTQLPKVQLIAGSKVMTPPGGSRRDARQGNDIWHGVEIDSAGRQVAYHVHVGFNEFRRIPARGERSGRRIAWLEYGTDKRMDDVRGEPLLSLVMQSVKEIDDYRDNVQRKAAINALLAIFVQKDEDKIGSKPLTGAITRKDKVAAGSGGQEPSKRREYNVSKYHPGVMIDELQAGERPVGFHNQGTDEKFGDFEDAIVVGVAWANNVPPEILRLAFSNNYSASQAAINEFKSYLTKVRTRFGESFCRSVYVEWLIGSVLKGDIQAPGFLDAMRQPDRFVEFDAWSYAEWSGIIKQSTELRRQVEGYKGLVGEGWTTNDRAARELTGTKFRRNIEALRKENELKVQAAEPLVRFRERFGVDADSVLQEMQPEHDADPVPDDE